MYGMAMINRTLPILALLFIVFASPASAQQRDVPYWATIRASEINMRVGPSAEFRIDWVYRRQGLPVKVIRVVEGWRLIRDSDGTQGWVVARLLSPDRGAVVIGTGLAAMRDAPSASGKLKWKAEPGVVGKIGTCDANWCEFDAGGRMAWIEASRIWGSGEP